MFLNISNHPVEKWDEKQVGAAKLMGGEIVSIPFPNVPPEDGLDSVTQLAKEIKDKVEEKLESGDSNFAMVQGEFTLTIAIIKLLQKMGVSCVVACSKREVQELGNGKKIVQFNFVRFRDVPNLEED